jgi:hypothetical protein
MEYNDDEETGIRRSSAKRGDIDSIHRESQSGNAMETQKKTLTLACIKTVVDYYTWVTVYKYK